MTAVDVVLLLIVAGLWAAVAWHRTQARAVGELWWSCVGLAAIVTLKIGVVADPVNRLTGGVRFDELAVHLIGVVVVTLTLSWLFLVRFGTRRAYRGVRLGTAAGMLAFLVVTWFLAPVRAIPPDADWLPADVLVAPVMAVHWLGIHLFLLTFAVVFVALAQREARTLPPGYARTSVRLLIVAASLFGLNNAAETAAQVRVLAVGVPEPVWLVRTVNVLLIVVFALFLLAVVIPLVRSRREPDGERSTDARVESLWHWIRSGDAAGPDSGPFAAESSTLMDRVVDIRDQIWLLQRYVSPGDVAAAGYLARRNGLLVGTRARAHVTAACLELAIARRSRRAEPVAPPPANLARLGGGRTIAQEAHWLAAVADAVSARATGAGREAAV